MKSQLKSMNGFKPEICCLNLIWLTLFFTGLTLSATRKIFYSFALLLAMANPGKAQVIAQDSLAVYDLFYTPLVRV